MAASKRGKIGEEVVTKVCCYFHYYCFTLPLNHSSTHFLFSYYRTTKLFMCKKIQKCYNIVTCTWHDMSSSYHHNHMTWTFSSIFFHSRLPLFSLFFKGRREKMLVIILLLANGDGSHCIMMMVIWSVAIIIMSLEERRNKMWLLWDDPTQLFSVY